MALTFVVTKFDKFTYFNEVQFLKEEPINTRLLVETKFDKSTEINE